MHYSSLQIQDFLGRLDTLLKRGEIAYKNYMHNNQSFLHAKLIKKNNTEIRKLILKKSHLLPAEQQDNAIALLTHIDTWTMLWNELKNSRVHQLNDRFVFENSETFPKQSVESLLAYYQTLCANT